MQPRAYLNDQPYDLQPGESMLSFIRRHRGEDFLPTLCDAPHLAPFGSCRLCSVSVTRNGQDKTVAACHTTVEAGMRIHTHTEALQRLRRNIVELVLTDHPLDCLTCGANGDCRLQEVAAHVGITTVRYPDGANHRDRPRDESHPYLISDLSKCINCYLCVRACDEVQGSFVLSMAGRGFDSRIVKGADTSFLESPCVACGACAQVCPTDAITDIYQPLARQATDTVRTVCTYCGVGCNLEVARRENEVLSISAPYDAAANGGHTCVKGRYAFRFYNHPDRLRSPLIRRNGALVPVSWEEAYDFLAERLTQIRAEYGPDAIAGISSSRCTNEENYLMQKFIRAVIGTNNIDGCARICHAPTARGMQAAFGTGAATNSIADLQHTDTILIIGANPTTAHPVTGARIKQAVLRGKRLIVVDPRKTELARLADYHLQLRPGSNVALLNMMCYYILTEGLEDRDFIATRVEGFAALREQILALDIDRMETVCGVDREQVRAAARAYAQSPAAMCFHGLGVTEHYQGTYGVMLIANLAMLTGNIGRPGVGVNPLRGQNNVQGAADMGVQPDQGPGYLDMFDPELRRTYETVYGVPLPDRPGLTIPRMIEAAADCRLKALWIMGEDVVHTEPNTEKVKAALPKLDLLVLQELFLSETAAYADVILPAASFLEKSGTFTNGERRVQRVNRVIDPLPGTRPDGQIMVEIMNRMGYPQPPYDPATVLDEIARVVPFFAGISWDRLGKNGLQWPVAADGTDTQILHTESFKHGKGRLHFIDFAASRELTIHGEHYPLILTTNRGLAHYNSGSMTRRTPDVELVGEDVLLIHPADAHDRQIADGDRVRLRSAHGETHIRARLSDQVAPGVTSATFHFPEILVNRVTSDVLDAEADCPEYKVVAVEVEKAAAGA
jgi:formate dehydrogenase major subunit